MSEFSVITPGALARANKLQQQYRAGIDGATTHGGVEFWLGMTLACHATLASLELLNEEQHGEMDAAAHAAAYDRHRVVLHNHPQHTETH